MFIELNRFNIDRFFDEEYKLFNTKDVKFTHDVHYAYTSDYEGKELISMQEDMQTFGIVERNDSWVIPTSIVFELRKANYGQAYFEIVKNGIDLEFYDIEDIEIDIKLTNFGVQCERAAKLLNKTIDEVREDIINYSQCFNIKIDE